MASLDLSALTKYTDELSGILLKESVLMSNTFKYISIQKGVKYKDSINLLTSALTAQAGGCGAISPAGSTVLSQREIEVCPLKVEESICIDEFEQYWAGQLAKQGSYNEMAPEAFNEIYLADKTSKISNMIDNIFWQGDTTGGVGNLGLCNGIIQILTETAATSSVVTGTTVSGALTTANAIAVVDEMIGNIPADIVNADDLILFMSHANFRTLMQALRNNNYFYNYDGQAFTWVLDNYLNTNVKVVATTGLVGSDVMLLTPASNLYFGTDSFGEALNGDGFQFWYDMRDNTTYFRAKFKLGAQVAFPQYCVIKAS